MKTTLLPILLIVACANAQTSTSQSATGPMMPPPGSGAKGVGPVRADEGAAKRQAIQAAERDGIDVRIKGIAHFRGIRSNQIMGTGLVVGLAGSGDTRRSVVTQQIISNMFKEFGIKLEPAQLDMKNIAAVIVTADLPPFSSNGQTIDVQVQSIGDAKSLVGGTLLQTPLYAAGDQATVYASAQGSVNVGGFDFGQGGASQKKNHVTAGRVPDGGIVERGAPTKLVYDGKLYLDLNQPDLTTAQRVAAKINEAFPAMQAFAGDGGSVEIALPENLSPVEAMSKIEALHVSADTPETIVINEKTGTITIGGNVRLGPAIIVHGSLNVKIDQDTIISQPNPFTLGSTQTAKKDTVKVTEKTAQVATLPPTATIADLAKIFQALQLKASDVIAILQALKDQGALKARIKVE